jgi:hypothetical protein
VVVERTLPKLSPARNTTYGLGDGMDSPANRRASISVTLSSPLISSPTCQEGFQQGT